MKNKKQTPKKKIKPRAKPVKRTNKQQFIPLMNPYANLQASAVAYTPEDMVLKTQKDTTSMSKPNYTPGMAIESNVPSVNRTVIPSLTSNQPPPSNDDTSVGKMNEKSKAKMSEYYKIVGKYGAEAGCAYLLKNPIMGLSLAPICGYVGTAVANATVNPFLSAVDYYLGKEKKLNEGINDALSSAWGAVKSIF